MMADADLSLTIESLAASLDFSYMEMFQGKAHVDGDTAPITLGSVAEPELIVVIGDRPGITFHVGADDFEIGAYPFGVWSNIGGDPASADNITITGSGECVVLAYGDS